MKRIPLKKIILGLAMDQISGLAVVKFIQNNYRRRIHKPYQKKTINKHI